MPSGYDALRTTAAWLDLSARGRIYATGGDRARLLHAITTNHVLQLTPGTGCYAFFLNAQGHILADVNLLCLADRFLLDTEPETRELVVSHVDKYIIADDVSLADVSATLACLSVEGPHAQAVMTAIGAPSLEIDYANAVWNGAVIARISITGEPGYRIFAPVEEKTAWIARIQSAGAVPAKPDEARIVRLEHGKPRYGDDISNTTLPQETQQMHAVHFAKGCYLGQEIVERIRSRGHVNRLLVKLEMDDGNAPPGAQITSSAYSPALGKTVALAYVRA